MKKYMSVFLCLCCVLVMVSCGDKAEPMELPQASQVKSVEVSIEENRIRHTDQTWIGDVLAEVSAAEPTRKQSVQDVPQAEHFIRVDIYFGEEMTSFFAYEDGGRYYIERPYQGIYKTDKNLYEKLQESE
ncbi:MAG: DUF5301 domain-containing protein [Filifactor alocis]|nr:DUF5301 domain-containing protein [Filifactor alocis]